MVQPVAVDDPHIDQPHVPQADTTPRKSRRRQLYESRREREFYRYFEPIRALTESGPRVCNLRDEDAVKNHQPISSPDRALTAFCQLGALRLGTRRAMLFFFDTNYAYVLAEATRTLSLQDDSVHEIADELWLGHSIIPRGYSICEETVCRLPEPDGPNAGEPNHSLIHIINDLEQDTQYCDRPYVTDGPKARFYAGVPITTPKGINIGAYCLLDDVTRPGLDEKAVAFMKDMASTIMVHLEMVRAKAEHERGTQMITGLGAFIEGASSLRGWHEESHRRERKMRGNPASPSESRPPPSPSQNGSTAHRQAQSPPARRASREVASQGETSNYSTESVMTLSDVHDNGGTTTPCDLANATVPKPAKTSRHAEDLRHQLVASNVRVAFERAARLVREAVNVDGTLFLDASVGTYGGLVETVASSDQSEDAPLSGAEATEVESEEHRLVKGDDSSSKTCKILSSSHTSQDHYHTTGELQRVTDRHRITEKFLRSLLRRYPHGKIWNFNEEGDASSDDESSEGGVPRRSRPSTPMASANDRSDNDVRPGPRRKRLRIDDGKEIQRLFPGVRSLALVGMWDQGRGRWYSACAVWTYSPLRLFSQESEVAYLRAFNDVVVAEVHRLEALNSDSAKSDFISSISHELRSPLHGILGSVECLQEQPADSFSAGLTSQIDICGRTLLDIVDHLLDFSKINYHAKAKLQMKESPHNRSRMSANAERMSQLGGMMSQDADVALDEVTEEVVETAVYSFCCSRDKETILNRKVAVIFDIDRAADSNWRCRVPIGGWKRICINLVSNALKYTNEGYIRVTLRAEPIQGKRKRFNVVFTVTDSGKGMSREFVENHLFKAFSQEDSLMEGTGLGMSLVAKIVKAMGGKIEVQSEKGAGTTMTVTAPMDHSSRAFNDDFPATPQRPFEGSSIGILGFHDVGDAPAANAHENARVFLLSSLQQSCEHLSIKTRRADWTLEPKSDVYLISEKDLKEYHEHLRSRWSSAAAEMTKPLIIFCDSAISARQLKAGSFAAGLATVGIEFVAQPCGTERLSKAIRACFERTAQSQSAALGGQTTAGAVADLAKLVGQINIPASGAEPGKLPIRARAHRAESSSKGDAAQHSEKAAQRRPTTLPTPPERSDAMATQHQLHTKEDYLSNRSKSTGGRPLSPFPVDPVSPQNPGLRQTDSGISGDGMSLLLVDDNQINLQLLVNYARKQGHRKLTATDGMKAVEAYKAACFSSTAQDRSNSPAPVLGPDKPQVILMDINMPVMSGFEATRLIRAFEQQHGFQPAHIIALTGLGSASAQQEAFSSGVDLFLTKPVRLKELSKLLDEIRKEEAAKTAGNESAATV
ncbi:hypothetical protein LTR85_004433 [Meristemomyces frigidus]|nr:hypothetical protein LTR85_004433 [Meristemomyces frigidus]